MKEGIDSNHGGIDARPAIATIPSASSNTVPVRPSQGNRRDELVLFLRSLRHNPAITRTLTGFAIAWFISLLLVWPDDSTLFAYGVVALLMGPSLMIISGSEDWWAIIILSGSMFLIFPLLFENRTVFCLLWGFHSWVCSEVPLTQRSHVSDDHRLHLDHSVDHGGGVDTSTAGI